MYSVFRTFITNLKSSLSSLSLLSIKVICHLLLLLNVNLLYAESPDYSNTMAGASEIPLSSSLDGRISPNNDSDYFKIILTQQTAVRIETAQQAGQSNMDTYLRLYDASGTQLEADDDDGADNFSLIQRTLNAGTYYIRVHSYNNASSGYYTLHFFPNMNTINTRIFSKVSINGQSATNIRGELKMIGNQSICQTTDRVTCTAPTSAANNNSVTQRHVNRDSSSSSLESSTMAQLSLDPGDVIIWAGLYWQARLYGSSELVKRYNANKVLLKTPTTNGVYIEISSNANKFNWYYEDGYWDYSGMQEVTEYVKNAGNYWVANVQSTEGENMGAGWALSVIVQNENKTLKNISIYDGFQGVYNDDGYPASVSSDITNFLTPTKGTVNSRLFFFANESDRGLNDSTTK